MLSRDDLYNRLIYLVPEAKFVFWPDEGKDDNKGYDNVVKIPGWIIAWYPENSQPLPTLDQLNAVDNSTLDTWLESRRKDDRDSRKSKDLSLIAAFKIEKKTDPNLSFRDYLDSLEQISESVIE